MKSHPAHPWIILAAILALIAVAYAYGVADARIQYGTVELPAQEAAPAQERDPNIDY